MKYQIYGTNINYLLKEKILDVPNYIKIDVDGLEYLILKGAEKFLNNLQLKEILIELDESKKQEFNSTIKLLEKNNFKFFKKKRNEEFHITNDSKFIFNYIFKKINYKNF